MSFECIIISSLPYHSVEVQKANISSSTNVHNPAYVQALADSTDTSLLITHDTQRKAAALRCSSHPQEAYESIEVKVCGAYTYSQNITVALCMREQTLWSMLRPLPRQILLPLDGDKNLVDSYQSPRHVVCGVHRWCIIIIPPSSVEKKDFLLNLPLHCACYSGVGTSVIEELLHVYPQSVWQ